MQGTRVCGGRGWGAAAVCVQITKHRFANSPSSFLKTDRKIKRGRGGALNSIFSIMKTRDSHQAAQRKQHVRMELGEMLTS